MHNRNITTLFLDALHYPLILNELEKKFIHKTFIDPSIYLINSNIIPTNNTDKTTITFNISGDSKDFKSVIQKYLLFDKYKMHTPTNTVMALVLIITAKSTEHFEPKLQV